MTILELCDFLKAEMEAGRLLPTDKTNIAFLTLDRVEATLRFAIIKASSYR